MSTYQSTGDKRLLAKAEELANRLLPAFSSKTGMPYGSSTFRPARKTASCPIRPRSAP